MIPPSPPDPVFVLHGLPAMSCDVIQRNGRTLLLVGTSQGQASLYDPATYQILENVYDDPEKRSVVSVGENKESLWVQIRDYGVVWLSRTDDGWCVTSHVTSSHYGFCTAVNAPDGYIIFPHMQGSSNQLCVYCPSTSDICSSAALTSIPLCLTSLGRDVYSGDDAGTLTHFSVDTPSRTTQVSIGAHPLFCLSVCSTFLVIGSSAPPIYLLARDDVTRQPAIQINYPQTAGSCSRLCFSPSGRSLLAGFSDGSMRVFSVSRRTTLLAVHFHSGPICLLRWTTWLGRENVLSSAADEKLSFWEFNK